MEDLKDRSEDQPSICCIYISFHDEDENKLTLESILTSILIQLLRRRFQLKHSASEQLRKRHGEFLTHGTQMNVTELLELLVSESQAFSNIYLIVDALEACLSASDSNIQSKFMKEVRKLPNTWNLLITSRSGASASKKAPTDDEITVEAHKSDIELYIESRFSSITDLELRKSIRRQIVARSNGMLVTYLACYHSIITCVYPAHVHIGSCLQSFM